ncbi:MAG: inositol monophosphatase [Chloroflexi bacterium]|nr:inositol monophosphatase [Chloroflexota bacterium]
MSGEAASPHGGVELPLSYGGQSALEVAVEAVRGGGRIARARLMEQKHIEFKGRGNVVTDVDLQVEEAIVNLLKHEYPVFNILTEESERIDKGSEFTWIVDPLDGSRNYASGVPFFAVTIALARQQEVLLGVTHDPIRGELFRAQKGRGAFLNETAITPSAKRELKDGVIGFDMGYVDDEGKRALELMLSLWPRMQTMRVMGSAALGLAYAACGRLDLYFHHNLAPWDIAAGMLLVQEAGGVITDRQGAPVGLRSRAAIASNERLHREFRLRARGSRWLEGE